jgi:hypothetical protein
MAKVGILKRIRLGIGKLRRMYLHTMHREYIRRNLARRRGECRRCGACCKLMYACPYLDQNGKEASCVRHHLRWWNCRIFPVDERDLRDRDMVANGKSCGYHFDPPMPPQRWFVFLLALGLSIFSAVASASSRPERIRVAASFRGAGMPSGWTIRSGDWDLGPRGAVCRTHGSISGALNEHRLAVSVSRLKIQVWGARGVAPAPDRPAVPRSALPVDDEPAGERHARSPVLLVRFGSLAAGLADDALDSAFVAFGDDVPARRGGVVDDPRNIHNALVIDARAARLHVNRRLRATGRDVFGAVAAGAVKDVLITAAPGTLISAVRIGTPRGRHPERPHADGDAAYRAGDFEKAAKLYAAATEHRSEARYKLGEALSRLSDLQAAASAWNEAQVLDPEGPWGERARLALARLSLRARKPLLALRFVRDLVAARTDLIEEWDATYRLIAAASARLEEAGLGTRHIHVLRDMAQRLEWAGSPRARSAAIWELLATSYEMRGWTEDARVARSKAN